MIFKTNIVFLELAIILFLVIPVSSKEHIIKIALTENPPLVFTDGNNKPVGIYPDIIEYIAEKQGWTIEYLPCKWQQCQQKLQNRDIDLLMTLAYSEERSQRFDFTDETVFNNWASIYRRPGSGIESIMDLEGKKVVVVKSNIHTREFYNILESFNIKSNIIEVYNYPDVFRLIDEKAVDAGVINRVNGLKYGTEYNAQKTSIIFNPVELRFATPKGENAEIRAAIDRHMAALKKDKNSIYYQALDKWIGKYSAKNFFPAWLKWMLILATGLLLLLIVMNLILRVKIRQKTAELQKSHDRLEDMVRERTAELERSNKDLEQFAYLASHDLQEPLRMVASYVSLLQRRYKGKLDADADEFIAFAADGADRMRILINDLLALSRVGTRGKTFEPVETEEILTRTLADLSPAVSESGAVISHDALPAVMADSSQLLQVFQNLIANAIKFRGKDLPRIHISAEKRKGDWLFSFQDNGIGIDPAFHDRIFVIFQRFHAKDEYPGTGIGLAICKKIVERHGGRIRVESQPGKGSIFYFTIPGKKEN